MLAFSALLWLLSAASLSQRYADLSSARLEVSWIAALGHTLQHGQLSGRDYHYTYGLLSQVIAWSAWRLSGAPSAVAAFPYILLAFRAVALALFAAIVLFAVPRHGTRWLVIVLILVGLSNAFIETSPFGILFSYRSLAVVLGVLFFSRAQRAPTLRTLLFSTSLVGVWAFACQLLSADSGVYLVAGTVIATGLQAGSGLLIGVRTRLALTRRVMRSLVALTSFLIAWIAMNLALMTVYWATAPDRIGWLDYPLYTLELMRGYSLSMGTSWPAGIEAWQIVALVAALTMLLGVAWKASAYPGDHPEAWPAFLVAAALPLLRHATLRSDLSHIVSGVLPCLIALILIGAWLPGWRARLTWLGVAGISVAAFPLTNPQVTLSMLCAVPSAFDQLRELTARLAAPSEAMALKQSYPQFPPLVLNFPSENYVSISNGWTMLAPVLLAHNAHTPMLQEYFVRRLADNRERLGITYALDGIATGAIDDVQHITRLPLIFEHLYRNYTLESERVFGRGIYVLRQRPNAFEFRTVSALSFQVTPWNGRELEITLDHASSCALVKLEVRIDYPPYAFLGRPSRLVLRFFNGTGQVVHRSSLVALQTSQPFETYVSLMPPELFYRVFALPEAVLPKQTWRTVRLEALDTGLLGVFPSEVVISAVKCIQG